MEQIKSWQEFLECRANLLGHLADTARKCWHHENIVTNFYENHNGTFLGIGGPKSKVFGLKDKRLFYGTVRKIPKETFLHLYMAAAKYLPCEVDRYANKLGFEHYNGTRVPCKWHRHNASACCDCEDNCVEFDFFYLLFGNEKRIYSTIIHELCHTVHHNHKTEFWKLFEQKLREAALVERDYDGWTRRISKWNPQLVVKGNEYRLPQEWMLYGCMARESVEIFKLQHWATFYLLVCPKLRKIIRKKLQECNEEGLVKEYAQLYGVNYTDGSF